MRDFTIEVYRKYLQAIQASNKKIIRFDDFFMSKSKNNSFCIIRHDVDRKPQNALKMAQIEDELGIKACYFFRDKSSVFKEDIITKIFKMGHEIGYHYESLSEMKGDFTLALKHFEKNLEKFRKFVPIKTICMHGRPFSSYDNRDLWRGEKYHRLLIEKYKILGELYLDIDYTDIAYINDTGRNWSSTKFNKRDKVTTRINTDFSDMEELLIFLHKKSVNKLIFQIHPERWSHSTVEYILQYSIDFLINRIKQIL